MIRALTEVVEVFDDLGKVLRGLFVQVGDGDARSKHGIVWVFRAEVSGGFRRKVLLAT